MSDQQRTPEARREYVRIDDRVLLRVRPVDADAAAAVAERIADRVPDRFTVGANFAVNSRAMARLVHSFSAESPELARYLKLMDQKLNHLARLFVLGEVERDDYRRLDVNFSAGGIVFPSQEPFAAGDLLDLRIVLDPTLTGILTVARVVYCAPIEGGQTEFPWQVATEYLHIRESDRDLMCSHIQTRQTEQLRRHRDEEPS